MKKLSFNNIGYIAGSSGTEKSSKQNAVTFATNLSAMPFFKMAVMVLYKGYLFP